MEASFAILNFLDNDGSAIRNCTFLEVQAQWKNAEKHRPIEKHIQRALFYNVGSTESTLNDTNQSLSRPIAAGWSEELTFLNDQPPYPNLPSLTP